MISLPTRRRLSLVVFLAVSPVLLAGCFRFQHMNRDASERPERAIGSRAVIMMPGEAPPPLSATGSGGPQGSSSSSSSSSNTSQSGQQSSSGSGGGGDDGMVMISGGGGSADASTRDRETPIVGPFLTLLGYPFWIFGRSVEEKADDQAEDRARELEGQPAQVRTSANPRDDAQRRRLEHENERIRSQLEQRQSSAGGGSIADELAALERSLGGSRPEPAARPTTAAVRPPERRESVDRNRDGRPDLFSVRTADGSLREELDDDHDGRVDRLLFYDANRRLVKSEEDLDGNGSFETVSHFADGQIARRRSDSDGDGQADSWSFYRGGELARHETDRDGDGFRDLVTIYEAGELKREEDDRNRDGRPDLVSLYSEGAVVVKHDDVDYDGLPDITSYYEEGKLVRRQISSESVLETWSPTSGS